MAQQTDENGKPLTYWGGVDFTNKNANNIKSDSTTSSQIKKNMMTPKEKAKEIYDKFYGIPLCIKTVKQCCNIVINETMDALTVLPYGLQYFNAISYWIEVEQEIEKL